MAVVFLICGYRFRSTSIGIKTIIPKVDDSVEHFIREADIALYQAKESRNCYIAV